MVRLLVAIAYKVIAVALGFIVAGALLDGFEVTVQGFLLSVAVFTVATALLEPFIQKVSQRYVAALSGGTALVTVFISLVLTQLFTSGVALRGLETWIFAPLLVWLTVVVAAVVLPLVLFKRALGHKRGEDTATTSERAS